MQCPGSEVLEYPEIGYHIAECPGGSKTKLKCCVLLFFCVFVAHSSNVVSNEFGTSELEFAQAQFRIL